jgi:hypothetical protein
MDNATSNKLSWDWHVATVMSVTLLCLSHDHGYAGPTCIMTYTFMMSTDNGAVIAIKLLKLIEIFLNRFMQDLNLHLFYSVLGEFIK